MGSDGRGLPLPAHPAQLTAESPVRRLRCYLTPEKRQDPAPVCSASSPCSARPRWCTEVPNQAAVRISGPSSSHVSSQPVIAALRLVLPHACLPRATTELWSRPPCLGTHAGRSLLLFPAFGKATLPHGWSAKRTPRRHCSNRSAAPSPSQKTSGSLSECRADSSPRCAAQGHFAQQARSDSALRTRTNHHTPALLLWCSAQLREGSW